MNTYDTQDNQVKFTSQIFKVSSRRCLPQPHDQLYLLMDSYFWPKTNMLKKGKI
jgi:hypothetical protein